MVNGKRREREREGDGGVGGVGEGGGSLRDFDKFQKDSVLQKGINFDNLSPKSGLILIV